MDELKHNARWYEVREGSPVERASGVNKIVVDKWFNDYNKVLDELGIRDCAPHIFNTNESGLQDHFVSQSIVGWKGHAMALVREKKERQQQCCRCIRSIAVYLQR